MQLKLEHNFYWYSFDWILLSILQLPSLLDTVTLLYIGSIAEATVSRILLS